MHNTNGTTARWIGIIVALLVSISGWLYATTVQVKLDEAKRLEKTVESHEKRIASMETQVAVLRTDLLYIRSALDEIKQLLREHENANTATR